VYLAAVYGLDHRTPSAKRARPDAVALIVLPLAWTTGPVSFEGALAGFAAPAMDALNERGRRILTERRLTDEPKTLEELSQVYDVSRERIRQIEVRAFEKLQKALMNLAGERRLLPAP
jgi:hypothetical protein